MWQVKNGPLQFALGISESGVAGVARNKRLHLVFSARNASPTSALEDSEEVSVLYSTLLHSEDLKAIITFRTSLTVTKERNTTRFEMCSLLLNNKCLMLQIFFWIHFLIFAGKGNLKYISSFFHWDKYLRFRMEIMLYFSSIENPNSLEL